jgi:hypothetical protein
MGTLGDSLNLLILPRRKVGKQARAHIETFVEAGATWWCEFVLPGAGEADQALARIKQGPPR